MSNRNIFRLLVVLALTATAADLAKQSDPKQTGSTKGRNTVSETAHYGLGRSAIAADFARHNYLVGPKGTGLPKGRGTAKEGSAIYAQSCTTCHGLHGEGSNNYPPLVGGQGSIKSDNPLPTGVIYST